MDTIFKTYRADVKDIDEEDGSLNLFIPVSTDSVDRDGEVVEPLAFKKTLPKFMKRPVLVASHDYRDLTNQIGEWSKLKITDSGIEGKPKYYVGQGNEQADWGFKLASKGMAAFSIGFIPKVWVDGDGVKEPRRTYTEVELLEISQVIVPSNREAIQSIRAKGIDPITNKLMDDVLNDKELITKPEETEDFIHIPAKGEEGKHEGHRIRTIPIDKDRGISARYCGECKKIISYMFAKDHDWTMAKARAWVKEHEKSVVISITTNSANDDEIINATIQTDDIVISSPRARGTSQEEIIDEIDYLNTLIVKEGISDKVLPSMWVLVKEILRLSGDDIPVDIRGVLSPKAVLPLDAEQNKVIRGLLTPSDILEAIKRIAKT